MCMTMARLIRMTHIIVAGFTPLHLDDTVYCRSRSREVLQQRMKIPQAPLWMQSAIANHDSILGEFESLEDAATSFIISSIACIVQAQIESQGRSRWI